MNKDTSPLVMKIRAMGSLENWRMLLMRNLEKIRGLDFETIVHPEEVGLDPAKSFRSSPSGNRFLENVLAAIPVKEGDSIIDIGCGKGSAMRTMLRHPFVKVAGIELAPALSHVAEKNFQLLDAKRAEIHTSDAATFSGYQEFDFFYFYNPFPAAVMDAVLDRILGAAHQNEKIFIYNNPTCHQIFLKKGLKHIRTFPDQWGNGIYLYTTHDQSRIP